MPMLTIFNSIYCDKGKIFAQLRDTVDFNYVTDGDVVRRAATLSGMNEKPLNGAFRSKTSVFNQFTHEKERAIAWPSPRCSPTAICSSTGSAA